MMRSAMFAIVFASLAWAGSGCATSNSMARSAGRGQGAPAALGAATGKPTPPAPSASNASAPAVASSPLVPAGGASPAAGSGVEHGAAVSLRSPADPASQLQAIAQAAAERYSAIASYIARLRRREQVNGRDKPEEVLLFKFRREPFSVYFKWLGSEGAGREVVYVRGRYGNMLHTRLAAGDMPLTPAGRRMALAPDNVFVRSASRHSITEAGIGHLVDQFATLVVAERPGRGAGTLKYLGPQTRPEFAQPVQAVEQTIPVGLDPRLPQGGRRWWMFDSEYHLPLLLITQDHTGHEVEYYCYDRLQLNVRLDDADFDPDQLWPAGR